MEYKPDFLIVPGVVAYDEDITDKGARLYSIIYWMSRLSNQRCTASNQTLADIMGKGTTADYVKKLLTPLEKKGYISRLYKPGRVDGQLVREEIIPLIFFGGSKPPIPRDEMSTLGGVEMSTEISKTIISKSNKYILLSSNLGKTPLSRLKSFYTALYRDEFGVDPRVFLNGKDGGVLKSLLKEYTEVQIAVLMIIHFNWYGPTGQDEREFRRLREATFPITWISPNINKYIVYLQSVHKREIGDEKGVYSFLTDYISGLSTGKALLSNW